MKDIFVSCSKEDKNLSKKLISKLESAGYSCYTLPRDKGNGNYEKLIKESKIFILLLSSFSEKSGEISKHIQVAVENNRHIIPFRTGKTSDNLGMKYMLAELEWVDAYEDGFDEAYEILLEIIEEITEGKKTKPAKKIKQEADNGFELKKTHLYGIIGILAVLLLYFVFFNTSDTGNKNNISDTKISLKDNEIISDIVNSDLKPEERQITGSWKMTGYEDSRKMTPEERKLTEQSIEQMKSRVLLTFNPDRSFTRKGFTPQIQRGYWEYDADKKKIYLIPENANHKEEINIINLSDKEMTFVVNESVETSPGNFETVTTKLSFTKQ